MYDTTLELDTGDPKTSYCHKFQCQTDEDHAAMVRAFADAQGKIADLFDADCCAGGPKLSAQKAQCCPCVKLTVSVKKDGDNFYDDAAVFHRLPKADAKKLADIIEDGVAAFQHCAAP